MALSACLPPADPASSALRNPHESVNRSIAVCVQARDRAGPVDSKRRRGDRARWIEGIDVSIGGTHEAMRPWIEEDACDGTCRIDSADAGNGPAHVDNRESTLRIANEPVTVIVRRREGPGDQPPGADAGHGGIHGSRRIEGGEISVLIPHETMHHAAIGIEISRDESLVVDAHRLSKTEGAWDVERLYLAAGLQNEAMHPAAIIEAGNNASLVDASGRNE